MHRILGIYIYAYFIHAFIGIKYAHMMQNLCLKNASAMHKLYAQIDAYNVYWDVVKNLPKFIRDRKKQAEFLSMCHIHIK